MWDTAQFLIFVLGIDENFHEYVELFKICGLNGTTKGEDLFHRLEQAQVSWGLSWDKLISITTDGGKNMSGHNKGVGGRVNSKLSRVWV